MPEPASGTVHPIPTPPAEAEPGVPTADESARELMRRLQAAVRARTGELGGWPTGDDTLRILDGWFAEHGLHMDDEVPR
jgi:hypothetical protein